MVRHTLRIKQTEANTSEDPSVHDLTIQNTQEQKGISVNLFCRVTDITGSQPTIKVQRIWTEGSVAVSHLRSAVHTFRKAKAKKP